jgi:type I restriction enzyme R subunit
MQLHLESEDTREKFYESLRDFSNVLGMALANANFQETTEPKTIQRYKDDFKMFHSLRITVKQRFGETVDYSSYEIQIRNLVNKYIGADTVKQIIKPVDLFNIDGFERELEGISGDAAKADTIASRLKKTCIEKMQEDPLLYKKLSEVINEAIAEHRAKRLSDAAYLERMKDALNETRTKGESDIPDRLKSEAEARAYYRVVLQEFSNEEIQGVAATDISADIAIKINEIINRLKKRDWVQDSNVKNQMKNEIEDYLFSIKGRYDLNWDFEVLDRIINENLDIAESREIQN